MQQMASITVIVFLVLVSSLQANVDFQRDMENVDGDSIKFQPVSSHYDKRQFFRNLFNLFGGSNPQTTKAAVSVTTFTPTQSLTSTTRPTVAMTASNLVSSKSGNSITDLIGGIPIVGKLLSNIFGGSSSGNINSNINVDASIGIKQNNVTPTQSLTSTTGPTVTPTQSLTSTAAPTVATTASNSASSKSGNSITDLIGDIPIFGKLFNNIIGGSSTGNINSNINVDASIGMKQNDSSAVQGVNLPSTSSTVQVNSDGNSTVTPVVAPARVNLLNLSNTPIFGPALQNFLNGLSNVAIGNNTNQVPPAKDNLNSIPIVGPLLQDIANGMSNIQSGNTGISPAQPPNVILPTIDTLPIVGPFLNGLTNTVSALANGNSKDMMPSIDSAIGDILGGIPFIGPAFKDALTPTNQPIIKPDLLSNFPPFGDIFRNLFPTTTNPGNISSVINQIPFLSPIVNSGIGILRQIPIIGPVLKNIFPGGANGNNYIFQIPFIGSILQAMTACLSHLPLIGQLFGPPSPSGCLNEMGKICGNVTLKFLFLRINVLSGPCGLY